jgi:putative transposase
VIDACYRYQPKRRAENEVIADWLIRQTQARRNWAFGLRSRYLYKVNGFPWNQKR